MTDVRKFDLNIKKILDNWEVYHAVREVIANALDESALTGTEQPDITKDDKGLWHIRDYGRGLNYHHLTQNENDEKKKAGNVIGKFGIGLKDALAVFYKNNVDVHIYSRDGDITLGMAEKEGFSDEVTLHALVSPASEPDIKGTDFVINVSDEDIEKAKSLFLVFSDHKPLDTSEYGEVYKKDHHTAAIYVHGVKVAEEDNYAFDYNITKTNKKLEKSLNRERSAVGRTAYSDIIRKLLLSAKSGDVISHLIEELKSIPLGTNCDEINLVDIQVHAMKLYNAMKKVVYISSSDSYLYTNDDKEKIKESGREVIVVPDNAYQKAVSDTDYEGNEIGTFDVVLQEYNDSFEYQFVDYDELSATERKNLDDAKILIFSIYGRESYRNKIRISENINEVINGDTLGVYSALDGIVLKRSILSDFSQTCEVMFHELVHASSGYPDNDRRFENELGTIIGRLSKTLSEVKPIEAIEVKIKEDKIKSVYENPIEDLGNIAVPTGKELDKLLAQHKTATDIAKLYQVNTTTAKRWIRKLKLAL